MWMWAWTIVCLRMLDLQWACDLFSMYPASPPEVFGMAPHDFVRKKQFGWMDRWMDLSLLIFPTQKTTIDLVILFFLYCTWFVCMWLVAVFAGPSSVPSKWLFCSMKISPWWKWLWQSVDDVYDSKAWNVVFNQTKINSWISNLCFIIKSVY